MAKSASFGDRKKQTPVNLEEFLGELPPQALEVEEAVLGALLVEPNCIDDTMDELPSESCFYDKRNAEIFIAMRELYNAHKPVDVITVTEQLLSKSKMDEIGGPQRLAELSTKVGAAAHIEYYVKVLKEKFIQRSLITACITILKTSYDAAVDGEKLIDIAQTKIFEAIESHTTKDAQEIGSVINRAMAELEKYQNSTNPISGVPSGFSSIDNITLGWQPSDLIILAARPSVGKTAFALNIARNAAVMNYPVAVFSLEMPAIQLVKRMIVSETGIDSKKIKGGVKLEPGEWNAIETQLKQLAAAPLYIDDTPSLPVMEFRSKVKKLVKQKGVKLIVVDYLQLMQGPVELRGMREQEVAAISRTLKATAKEHNVPIIALSQLSRQSVQRQGSNNRPQLNDLRESGSIEQDADMVLFIHRLDYQGLTPDENVQKGQTQLIIAKHRNGEIGDVDLLFRDSEARFVDAGKESLNSEFVQREYASSMNSSSAVGPSSQDTQADFEVYGGSDSYDPVGSDF